MSLKTIGAAGCSGPTQDSAARLREKGKNVSKVLVPSTSGFTESALNVACVRLNSSYCSVNQTVRSTFDRLFTDKSPSLWDSC